MKFHNQKSFMGHEISNVTNKPLLHKKGKQWIVVAVSALILAGFGGMVSTTTHADTTQPTTATKVAQPSQNNGNSSKVAPTSNPTKNNSAVTPSNNKPVVHMLGGSNLTDSTPTIKPDTRINHDGLTQTAQGNWGTATWNLYNNGQLDIHDGDMESVNNFNASGYNYNSDAGNATHRHSSNNDLNPNDVISIKTFGVTAPVNASGLFSGDNGGNQNSGGSYNHFNNVKSIDLSGLYTSNTTDMSSMFHGDYNLSSIKFGNGNFNTSKVTDMEAMFDDDGSLDSLDLNGFDTRSCNNFDMMFYNTPGLEVLDISNFVIDNDSRLHYNNGNAIVNEQQQGHGNWTGMFGIGHNNKSKLTELVVGPYFQPVNDTDLDQINSSDTSSIKNPITSVTPLSKWSDIVSASAGDKSKSRVWIKSDDTQPYTITLHDELANKNMPNKITMVGIENAPFLPLDGIKTKLPTGYELAPNDGTTVNVNTTNNTAVVNIYNMSDVSHYGTWGKASWMLYNNGNLLLAYGQITDNVNDATNNLSNCLNDVNSITTNNAIAPTNSDNLFSKFTQANPIDLTGMDFSSVPASNISNMFHNNNVEVHFNNTIDGDLYENLNNTSSMAQSNSSWISNNSASLSSASNSASDADKWVNSYGSNASNAGSWYANNSSSVNSVVSSFNSVSNSAQSAYSYYTKSSASISNAVASLGSLNSAWTSASNAWSYVSSESASISTAITNANDAVNDYNNDTKSSLSTAYASANSAYTSLTSQKGSVQSAISRLNSMNNSFATAYNSATNAESYLEKNSGSFATLSSDISKDNTNLSNAIANKADNSILTADSNALNTAINNAQSWINSNSASLNNASNEANEASNSAKTNASDISSNSSSIASLSTNANTNSANATSSVNSLSNSASAGISNNSSSITSLSSSAKNASVSASSSVASLSNSANAGIAKNSNSVNSLSGSASKGIASNATRISNNSNNINTNSKTASNGISNANASASASASVASSNAQLVANQNSASASISAFNANSNADSYALSLAQNATGVANANAGGIDNTMSYDDQTVQSLSNTVNANTISLANNDNDLYQSKENKPATKKHGAKIAQLHQPLFYFYALKPLWLHTSAKFTKGNRAEELSAKHGYTLPITRIFKVNGALRFEVKIDGAKYFVTGNRYFARNAYIQPNEVKHNSSVKVLRAIREYKRAGFGKKNFIKGIRKGTVLPIKQAKTVANKQVTRLQLTNGHWITANKNLVKLI